MLANGKDVNYLMLNGEVFGSEKRFPAEYDFGKSYDSVQIYGCSITENGFKFDALSQSNNPGSTGSYYPSTAEFNRISIVFCEAIYLKEKYILVRCDSRMTGTSWIYGDIVWIKLKDVGGVLNPAQ